MSLITNSHQPIAMVSYLEMVICQLTHHTSAYCVVGCSWDNN